MKRFDSAQGYESDIARVVPGHALLRQAAVCELRSVARTGDRLGVVGPGPGQELPVLASALPGVSIDAVEPSAPMAAACERRVQDLGLTSRICVRRSALQATDPATWDLGLSLLVAHLIDANGPDRRNYWTALASHLRPGGVLVHGEISCLTAAELDAWAAYSASQGCDAERVATLRERLTTGFSLLPWDVSVDLAHQAGLHVRRDVFRIWGLRLAVFERIV
jgi:SAM-dependent methyltransferase